MTNRTRRGARGVLALGALALAGAGAACSWSVTVNPDGPDRTIEALGEENAALSTQVSQQATLMSHLATRVSAPFVTPPWMPEPTPPVYGYVDIEDGRCCVGGTAGSTVDVRVAFGAESPFAEVTEMRARAGARPFDEFELAEAPWEPFVAARIFPVPVPINWSGFYVSVQYRDARGNLSPVFSDDISVEGMPVSPTPTPLPPPGS
jgi:hypothetical protein